MVRVLQSGIVRVTFFHAGASEFPAPASIDPDHRPELFVRGEHIWTVQTFLRLLRAGLPVSLADRAAADGLVVFHVKERRALLRTVPRGADLLLVGIRADNRESGLGDIEVVQNGRFADGRRRIFIPHWPQPGLVPRDPSRGDVLRTAAFKGFAGNLAEPFRSAAWREFLGRRGIEWVFDAPEFEHDGSHEAPVAWWDYSGVDLVVAVREAEPRGHTAKPAAKLCNAWQAGVPALLGPEYAFRELRRSNLDYLEVASLAEAEAAVARLQEEPGLFRAMVENGRRRAVEFSVPAILERWRALLFDELPAFAGTPRGWLLRRWPARLKIPLRRLGRRLAMRPTR